MSNVKELSERLNSFLQDFGNWEVEFTSENDDFGIYEFVICSYNEDKKIFNIDIRRKIHSPRSSKR